MTLSKEDILAIPLPEEVVDTAWGPIRLRGMSSAERDAFEMSMLEKAPDGTLREKKDFLKNARARLLVRCIVGDDGERLFSDDEADDLGAKDGRVLNKLWDVARKLCGLSPEDIEELAEGFANAQAGDSSSG